MHTFENAHTKAVHFYDLYKILLHIFEALAIIFEALTVGCNVHEAKNKKMYAACGKYELDSSILVPRLAMKCSVMNLLKPQALRTPFPKIAERLRLSAPP